MSSVNKSASKTGSTEWTSEKEKKTSTADVSTLLTIADSNAYDFNPPLPSLPPPRYVPHVRGIRELYMEDKKCAEDYAMIVNEDHDVHVGNVPDNVLFIDNWEAAELEPRLLKNIKERSYFIKPRKIQGAVIPFILDEFDVVGHAETGSGKTASYLIPIIDLCMRIKGNKKYYSKAYSPLALIIGPTRELILQIFETALKFTDKTGVSVGKAYGQYNSLKNMDDLLDGCDILCATPGRLQHFLEEGYVVPNNIRFLVLDEANRMLEGEFLEDIRKIVQTEGFPHKEKRQTLLFSAFMTDELTPLIEEFCHKDYVFITNSLNCPNKRIQERFIKCNQTETVEKAADLLLEEVKKLGDVKLLTKTLIFLNSKHMSEYVAQYLTDKGIPAKPINGDHGQDFREQSLYEFRTRDANILVASDVMARGLDVKDLDRIMNVEMPEHFETYLYRIGRTGRIRPGVAINFGNGPLFSKLANARNSGTEAKLQNDDD